MANTVQGPANIVKGSGDERKMNTADKNKRKKRAKREKRIGGMDRGKEEEKEREA